MITIENIVVEFNKQLVLDSISLECRGGEIIGLVAPNGTGKSTLLNVLMNSVTPNQGTVLIKGRSYDKSKNRATIYESISIMPDQSELYNHLSGYDHLKIYQQMWHKTAKPLADVIDMLNLSAYINHNVSTYSLGMRQRLAFAMQLVANTDIMLMDELMNGLDPDNVELISQVLVSQKEQGKCLIIASHLLANLDLYATRVLFLKKGKIVFDYQPEETKQLMLKFMSTNHSPLIRLASKDVLVLPNGKSCVEFEDMTELEILIKELNDVNIRRFEVAPLSLEDYYALYYSSQEKKDNG